MQEQIGEFEAGSIDNLWMNFVVKSEKWGSSWRRMWDLESFCFMADVTGTMFVNAINPVERTFTGVDE